MILVRAISAILITIVALPFAIIGGLFFRERKCTPEVLAADLKALADGTGDDMAWDNLESVRIADHRHEAIRQEALTVNLPLQPAGREILSRLATKAKALAS